MSYSVKDHSKIQTIQLIEIVCYEKYTKHTKHISTVPYKISDVFG